MNETTVMVQIERLHKSFCEATSRDLPMNPAFSRWWYDSLQYGVTPEMVKAVMESRMKREYSTAGMRLHCLSLRHCIGDEDRLAQFVDEAAQIAAAKRKKVYSPAKAEALRATHRPDEPEASPPRHVSEIFEVMRKQAQ